VLQPLSVSKPPAHGVQHQIITEGRPATAKFRRLDTEKLAAAKQEFQKMLAAGIVRRSSSQWSSPLHMVRKKDGTWRPCGDYRRLNLQTKEDRYPLPNMGDLAARLDGCQIFSKLDLQKGYLQVPVAAADVAKTAIITPFGLFEFVRMPFGLRNAGMTFQRLMDNIFFDLPFAFVYLDDVLVASRSAADHRRHLREVLQCLQDNNLVVNAEKCVFGQERIVFLGHVVTAGGVSPLPDRVAAIREFPEPANIEQLQAFLGLYNFYRRFVPAAAKLLKPLTDALGGAPKGSTPVQWSAAMRAAFGAAKAALAETAMLDHPASNAELSLVTDASCSHLGAALQQRRRGGQWRPLGFFSKKLSSAESRYSAFDRELLAVYASIQHFQHMLEGRNFAVFTDHRPLVGALARVSDPRSDRQRRHLSFIAEFTADIRHIAGLSNVVADTLSRPAKSGPLARGAQEPIAAGLHLLPPSGVPEGLPEREPEGLPDAVVAVADCRPPTSPPVDLTELAAAQPGCPDCQRAASSPALRVLNMKMDDRELLVDASSGVLRPLVPAPYRRSIFEAVHSLAHPGVRASRRLISSRFVWPGLARDVALWCKECQRCQRAKASNQAAAAEQPIAVPLCRFSHIHVDLVGPLPVSSEGFVYLLTVIDRSTRWAEAIPLKSATAGDCADGLISGWISRFGVPSILTSDRGVQFSSSLWAALMAKLGIKHKLCSAFHPQSNGLVERFHRRLKEALKARTATADWPSHIPWVLFGLRAAPRDESGVSAAELLYGSPLTLPGQFLPTAEPSPTEYLQQQQLGTPCFSPRQGPEPQEDATTPAALQAAEFVYVKSPPAAPSLTPAYRGPYKVVKKSDKYFIVRLGNRFDAITVDRLKPHLGGAIEPAAPPARGRPRTRRSSLHSAS
jgi:transposase InsO family protein